MSPRSFWSNFLRGIAMGAAFGTISFLAGYGLYYLTR